MDRKSQDEVVVLVRPVCMQSRKWQHDKPHEVLDRGAEKESAYQRIFPEEWQFETGEVLRSCRRARDEEVQQHAERIGSRASGECALPQQAAGNRQG